MRTPSVASARKQIVGPLVALALALSPGASTPALAWYTVPAPAQVGSAPPAASAPATAAPKATETPAETPAPAEPPAAAAVETPATPAGQTDTLADLANIPPTPPVTETFIALPPRPGGGNYARAKALKMTVGTPPTTADLGSEADTSNPTINIGEDARVTALNENWSFALKGYLRAPMRVGYGQSDASDLNNRSGSFELHSMPRMVGLSSSNWAYINIAPNPTASLRATVSNARVAATLIIGANQFTGSGFPDLDSQGGMTQAFMTLKFPETFGTRGGLAWTFGAFGNRYGYAGPRQINSGYYGTYLFGRTRVMGEALTANIDLTDRLELLVEHGFGAELDILPILGPQLEKQMFIPGDPHGDLGSNFVHHAHVALWVDDWLKVAGHYLTSWTPDDRHNSNPAVVPVQPARLSVVGGEVHLDHPRWGNGFLGYSYVWGNNLLDLNDALQVIHGSRGYDLKLQYFGNKLRNWDGSGSFFTNDGGHIHTVLFQHKFYSNWLLRKPAKTAGFMLGLFAMYSQVFSPPGPGNVTLGVPGKPNEPDHVYVASEFRDKKLKYGLELIYFATRNFSFGARYDRVQPTQSDPSPTENPADRWGRCGNFLSPFDLSCGQTYMATTAYVWLQPDWNSTRRVTISYTRFFMGDHVYPDSPYSSIQKVADPHLFMISALMSL